MIAFEEARRLITHDQHHLSPITVDLDAAAGMILSEDVASNSDQPRFDNTAIDGYAFRFQEGRNSYRVVGEVAAGDSFDKELAEDECVRIFTGAMIPSSADTCVMQEHVQRNGERIQHSDTGLRQGGNVRYKGEELKEGDRILTKGSLLNAASIGLLSACGVSKVSVYPRPRVHVIITGSEFTTLGDQAAGKIFNSNGPMLKAALEQEGLHVDLQQVDDNIAALTEAFKQAIDTSDMVITTGGVSVGDYDHVREVAEAVGVETKVHRVAQKPGKPMYYGTLEKKRFFGLPGNPRSVMIGFWIHVLPMLNAMRGSMHPELRTSMLPLGEELKLKGQRTEMLAVTIKEGKAYVARKQNSHMLSTLVEADGIAIIPPEHRVCQAGLMVRVYLLPAT